MRPKMFDLRNLFEEIMALSRPAEMPRRIQLCRQALERVDPNENPLIWGVLQDALGSSLAQNPFDSRASNLEQAIYHLTQATAARSRRDNPELWSSTQHNLGLVYRERLLGDPVENVEQSIQHLNQALEIRQRELLPAEWAMSQNDLAISYALRQKGDRAENIEQAILHYRLALEVYTPDMDAGQWAKVQNNLGATYLRRLYGGRGENLVQAIHHLEQALEMRPRAVVPELWAETQLNLAVAHTDRTRDLRLDFHRNAIHHAGLALEVYSRSTSPQRWAMAQTALADAYEVGGQVEEISNSISHYDQALEVFNQAEFPEQWATVQNKLANIYLKRVRHDHAVGYERAIELLLPTLNVYTRESFPQIWAQIQYDLGIAYIQRIRGERSENIERALRYLQLALEVFTRQDFPNQWALAHINLGNAYKKRVAGDPASNREQVLAYLQQALDATAAEADPARWAMIHSNLVMAYFERAHGARADNLEQAIHHAEQALTFLDRPRFPEDWALVQHNLGTVYRHRVYGEQAANIEQAIACFNQALSVRTRQANPEKWAMTQDNLGNAYTERLYGARQDNLDAAIHHYTLALEVRTREDYPEQWALLQNNLANGYFLRGGGKSTQDIERAAFHAAQALEVFTRQALPDRWAMTQSSLGCILLGLPLLTAEALEQAIQHIQLALEVYRRDSYPLQWAENTNRLSLAYRFRREGLRADNLKRAVALIEDALAQKDKLDPDLQHNLLANLGDLHFEQQAWLQALDAYTEAMEAGRIHLAAAYTPLGRQAEVSKMAQLHANATYCLIQQRRYSEAFVRLEQGKTRLMIQELALNRANLVMLPEDLQQELTAARNTAYSLESALQASLERSGGQPDMDLLDELRQARLEVDRIVEGIRLQFPDFMPAGLDTPELLALIPSGSALVAPCITSQGSCVFVVPGGTLTIQEEHIVMLPGLTRDSLRAWLAGNASEDGWLEEYRTRGGSWKYGAMSLMTRSLWDSLMGPIAGQLETLGVKREAGIILLPQGGLGLFPLHAAWREVGETARTFLDDYAVTYAPSGYVLHAGLRRLRQSRSRHDSNLLAVVNPTGDLTFAPIEAQALTALFDPHACQILAEMEATPEAVLRSAPGHDYVYFCCHSSYEWADARRSGLRLAGGGDGTPLTVNEIMTGLDLGSARMVILSSCESGLVELDRIPDEHVGLPTAFLQVGAPCVVCSLWEVPDFSTALLMERFFVLHLQGDPSELPESRRPLSPADALRGAQLWFRHAVTAGYVYQFCDQQVQRLKAAGRPIPGDLFQAWRDYAYLAWKDPDSRPFAHPYYWAAFILSGAGSNP